MEDHFVTSRAQLFAQDGARTQRFEQVRSAIRGAIDSTPEGEVLSADVDGWARALAEDHAVTAPRIDLSSAELLELGKVDVDCTNAPGISYGMSEWGNVIRPGFRMQLSVPVEGEATLLRQRHSGGGSPLLANIEGGTIVRQWNWPEVKGSDPLNADIEDFQHQLAQGTQLVQEEVKDFNASLPAIAKERIEQRQQEIHQHRDFLGSLTMPVRRDPQAPKPFRAPPIRPRKTPARKAQAKPQPAQDAEPDLDEFYDHILEVIRSVGRGLERSPGSFAKAAEETLRDHMLVTLNTHYVGATYAEAFNRSGKTDILIRVEDRNAFIGECKWWEGPKALHGAFDQLFGYTTWRDSRVALIFYVRTKDITATLDKAHAEIEGRDEFIRWESGSEEGELRCRVRWPDDKQRQATLTAAFFHLPKA